MAKVEHWLCDLGMIHAAFFATVFPLLSFNLCLLLQQAG